MKKLSRKNTLNAIHGSGSSKELFSIPKIQHVLLKKLRTYFFFVDDLDNLLYFLENTEVEFRITDGPQWNKPLAFASAFPFTHFNVNQSEIGEYV